MSIQLNITGVAKRIQTICQADSTGRLLAELQSSSKSENTTLSNYIPDPGMIAKIAASGKVTIGWLLFGETNTAAEGDQSQAGSVPDTDTRVVPPAVNMVLNHALLKPVHEHVAPTFLVGLVRDEIARCEIQQGSTKEVASALATRVAERAANYILQNRAKVNATGIIIHTGWGNARLHPEAKRRLLEAVGATATGAISFPSRTADCERLLCTLTGAEAATVTTLNAVNYLLMAGAIAPGRDVIVAARDLVEISQGARIGDLISSAGAQVVPVGSANCVYIDDYRQAITENTAMLLRVHASNIATSGYIAHVDGVELADLAKKNDLVYAENLGGGSLVDLTEQGLPWCPTLQKALADGADLVFASADKIIGGPQAGIIVGKKQWVSHLAKHPLARVSRPDKLTLAALEGTLAVYLAGKAWNEMPTLKLLNESSDELHARATVISDELNERGYKAAVISDKAECGGAVLPGVDLSTWVVQVAHSAMPEDMLYAILLARGVVARRRQGTVLLDLRSVMKEDDDALMRSLIP